MADFFGLDRITIFAAALYFILSLLIILIVTIKGLRRILVYSGIAVSILLVVSISIFFAQFNETVIQEKAVVVAKNADSKFEPTDDATTFFTLSEGEEVIIAAADGGWVKVKRLDGKQGWLKKSAIEKI